MGPFSDTYALESLQPKASAVSSSVGLLIGILAWTSSEFKLRAKSSSQNDDEEPHTEGTSRTTMARRGLRYTAVALALIFVLSAVLNLGAQIPLGTSTLSFEAPSSSIAAFELVIALVLLGSAFASNLYLYGGAFLFASVGLAAGLLSGDVQGFARTLHETMVPIVVVAWPLVLLEANSVYGARREMGAATNNREVITALQFFVGALVTLGGAAFVRGGTYPIGTALGAIHLAVGLTGLLGGYFFVTRKAWSRGFLLGINSVTIAYSAFAESLVELYAYLPPGFNDSLVGTVIAIIVSAVIIYLLSRRE